MVSVEDHVHSIPRTAQSWRNLCHFSSLFGCDSSAGAVVMFCCHCLPFMLVVDRCHWLWFYWLVLMSAPASSEAGDLRLASSLPLLPPAQVFLLLLYSFQ